MLHPTFHPAGGILCRNTQRSKPNTYSDPEARIERRRCGRSSAQAGGLGIIGPPNIIEPCMGDIRFRTLTCQLLRESGQSWNTTEVIAKVCR